MATNRHFEEANEVSLPVPVGTESGDAVCVGGLHVVAVTDRRANGEASCQLDGAFRFAFSGGAIVQGQAITGVQVGATEINGGDDTQTFGHALKAKANGATAEVPVRLAN